MSTVPAIAPNGFHEKLYPDTYARFARDVAGHEMNVMHDDGLYRHLRFMRPDRSMYWFDIITWPGSLVIKGDMGSFMFTRDPDMFGFFGTGDINPGYWAEKTPSYGGDTTISRYDPEHTEAHLLTIAETYLEEHPDTDRAEFVDCLDSDVLSEVNDPHDLVRAATDFRYNGHQVFPDLASTELKTYTEQFLWCCLAIPFAIRHYRHAKENQ